MLGIQREFTAFIEGEDYHLVIDELMPPSIMDHYQEHQGGGMDAPVDVALGLEKMEGELRLASRKQSLLPLVGLGPGQRKRVTYRGFNVDETDGTETPELIIIQGRINSSPEAWKKQTIVGVKYPIKSINYYKHVINGERIHEIDLINKIRIVNGVDQNASARRGLGQF